MLNLLLTVPAGAMRDQYFPAPLLTRLTALGNLTVNPHTRQYTREELCALLPETDIVLTHWGSGKYDAELLSHAPRLKMLAHCAGTVAHIVCEEFFQRGIPVLSANSVMARYVAEGALCYILSGLRSVNAYDRNMRFGGWRGVGGDGACPAVHSLIGAAVGMIGLGSVGRNLLSMLRPFSVRVKVCDPYLPDGALDAWDFAESASFSDAMSCNVVTIHASQTPETYHMINAAALALMPNDALLVNTARGAIVDMDALIAEAQSGRIRAVLDVYETEGVPQKAELLQLTKNVTLQPHLAGMPSGASMTEEILCDIERFLRGEAPQLCVSHTQFLHMTQEFLLDTIPKKAIK